MIDDKAFSARFDALRLGKPRISFRFTDLREIVRADTPDEVPGLLERVEQATTAGNHAAGYLAYEAAAGLGAELHVNAPAAGALPLAMFGIFADRQEIAPEPESTAGAWNLGEWSLSTSRARYEETIRAIKERIAAGETYQVNHTLHLRAPFEGCPAALYADLCRAQAASYCATLSLGAHTIVSASPELFFRWQDGRLELRPMKGTRPRGRWREEDDALATELIDSPKDRAENLMIVDMLRNDAGRVAEWGSVQVTRLWELESYPTVHQLTSSITARTRAGTSLLELFRALFPCGSVTGAPKVQTMKVIREMEGSPRGVYTGAIGFVSAGIAQFSVAIRTVVIDRRTGIAELGVGSGITWDSEPLAEFEECLSKAAFVCRPTEFELLETMLAQDGVVFLLDAHLARLLRSAEVLGFAASEIELRERISFAAAPLRDGLPHRLRLTLDRVGTSRIEIEPLPVESGADPPLRVAVSRDPVDSRDATLYHKTTDRRPYDRRRAARPDCDDVLLLNERGELTEATLANLVGRWGADLWTPPVSAGLLPGTYRGQLLWEGRIRERTIREEELASADAVYLINSVRTFRRAIVVE
jgi:para-aminobenzoate synthetase / 4-amino-4-deoxychorismate lyase